MTPNMTAALAAFSELAPELLSALRRLQGLATPLNLPPLEGREWFELLERKLVPQLGETSYLIVAVTGGTNIGKSVIFNHLAGFRASASSPLASGTKHPVCLTPAGFGERSQLAALFPSFQLAEWSDAQQSLADSDEHWLFWRESADVPANLLLLDTPDVDSDAPVNWERADAIRQTADVLIAVLTQQKYNDAAVKQFFRKAASEGKPAVVVFNQCELPDDETIWPVWLETFCRETGIAPLYVYLAPRDRQRAERIELTFHERRWTRPADDATAVEPSDSPAVRTESSGEVRLQDVFAQLHFAEIKRQSLQGALQLVADDREGLATYLREVKVRSDEFQTSAELLAMHRLAEVDDWPAPPSSVLIAAVREWWATRREGWSKAVHGFYDAVGQTLLTPFRWARDWTQGPAIDPWDTYREREWGAIVRAVGKVYQKLEWLADMGQPLLKSRINQRLSGVSRAELLDSLQRDLASVEFAHLTTETVAGEMQNFQQENSGLFSTIQRIDQAAAAARPVLTIVLGVTGVGLPLGEAATQLASHGLMQGALHVAGDVVGGTVIATTGETVISQSASGGAGYLQAKFHRLQETFTRRRVQWLADRMERQLLGSLTHELQQAAGVARSPEARQIATLLEKWRAAL